jgi:hypothetical protein
MSSILKALKKVEDNKIEPKDGTVHISREILQTSSKAKGSERWILPTALAALVLTASMLAYVLLGGFGAQDRVQVLAPVSETNIVEPAVITVIDRPEALFAGSNEADSGSVAAAERVMEDQIAAADVSVAAVQKDKAIDSKDAAKALEGTAEAPKTGVVTPKEVVVAAVQKKPVVVAAPTPAAKASPAAPVEAAAARSVAAKMDPAEKTNPAPTDLSAPSSVTAAQPSTVSATRMGRMPTASGDFPSLWVSEIHYQWEVTDRLAVVNDLPVMEGTVIEGARVDRILRDRVRFIHNGQYREVRLNMDTN